MNQVKRDLLAGMLFAMNAEATSCLSSTGLRTCKTKGFVTIGPVDTELSKKYEAEVHVFSESVLCMKKSAVNLPEIIFNKRWHGHLEQYRGSARRIDGEPIQVRFHQFLCSKTNETVLKIGEWIRQGK